MVRLPTQSGMREDPEFQMYVMLLLGTYCRFSSFEFQIMICYIWNSSVITAISWSCLLGIAANGKVELMPD